MNAIKLNHEATQLIFQISSRFHANSELFQPLGRNPPPFTPIIFYYDGGKRVGQHKGARGNAMTSEEGSTS
jgi:hypothetical protein